MVCKILILGVGGMLGHSLYRYFSTHPEFETYGTVRSKGRLAAYYSNNELERIVDEVDHRIVDFCSVIYII